jgi:ABC-type cobalamin transport system ATPase subunit
MVLVERGRTVLDGPPEQVMLSPRLDEVFGVVFSRSVVDGKVTVGAREID